MIKYKLIELLKVNIDLLQAETIIKVIDTLMKIRNEEMISEKLRFVSLTVMMERKIS